jgi:hypothetical protein
LNLVRKLHLKAASNFVASLALEVQGSHCEPSRRTTPIRRLAARMRSRPLLFAPKCDLGFVLANGELGSELTVGQYRQAR